MQLVRLIFSGLERHHPSVHMPIEEDKVLSHKNRRAYAYMHDLSLEQLAYHERHCSLELWGIDPVICWIQHTHCEQLILIICVSLIIHLIIPISLVFTMISKHVLNEHAPLPFIHRRQVSLKIDHADLV